MQSNTKSSTHQEKKSSKATLNSCDKTSRRMWTCAMRRFWRLSRRMLIIRLEGRVRFQRSHAWMRWRGGGCGRLMSMTGVRHESIRLLGLLGLCIMVRRWKCRLRERGIDGRTCLGIEGRCGDKCWGLPRAAFWKFDRACHPSCS